MHRSHTCVPAVAAVALACLAAGARPPAGLAAAPSAVAANPDSALAVVLGQLAGEPLTLEQALLAAADGSVAARTARAELDAARAALRREQGAFDPELFGETGRSSADQPTASFFAGADVLRTERTAGTLGARWRLRWGTELTAALDGVKTETNNAFASLDPEYSTSGRLSLRQPLLKGAGAAAAPALAVQRRAYEAAQAAHEDAVLAVRADVETAYWELHAAMRDLGVQRLIRERAAALLAEAATRASAGLVGPNQVANARTFLAEQEQAVLDREEALDAAADRLGSLIGRRPAGGAPRFLAASEPPAGFPAPDEEALVARALAANHELRAAERAVAAWGEQVRAAERNVLPRLDLLGSLGGSGLAGAGRDIVLPFGDQPETLRTATTGGWGESLDQVLRRSYPDWSVGLSFSLPLGGRADRGERDRLRAETARAEHLLEGQRRALADRVRASCRELRHGAQRLAAAREGVAAAEEQARIGLLEYHSGRTTAFELVRLSADLAAAQQRYSQALVRAARAAAVLRRLTANGYPESSVNKEMGS